jgi:hypothetical protein
MVRPPTLLAVLVLAAIANAQGGEPRIHDFGILLRGSEWKLEPDQTAPFLVPLPLSLPRAGDQQDDGYEFGGGYRVPTHLGLRADPEPLLDWVTAAAHVGGDLGLLRVGAIDRLGRALVEASSEAQARLERRLDDLQNAALRPFELELIRLPARALDALGGSPVLTGDEVAALLRAHPPLGAWRRSTRTGIPTVFRSGESRSYLRDVDVEVASGAAIHDPQMDAVHLGLLATVQVARGPRDGILVTAALRHTVAAGERRIAELEGARLGLPRLDLEMHAVRVPLRGNGTLVLGGSGPQASVWLLRIEGLGGSRPDAVPLGGVEAPPWQGLAPDWIGWRPVRPAGFDEFPDDVGGLRDLPAELLDAIAQHDRSEDVPGLLLGDAWVAAKESPALARVRALAAARAAGPALTLRYALAEGEPGTVAPWAAADADLDELARRARFRGLLPTRIGDLAVAFVGTEQAFVRDFDVEIAGESSVANPVVDSWFAGLALRLTVRPERGGDGFAVRGDVGHQAAAAGPQLLARGGSARGPLGAPRVDHLRCAVDTRCVPGRWRLVETAASGPGGRQLALLLRVDA